VGASEALIELDRVLTDSVGVHQRADVPYGMFFSGGIDSSVLLAMMVRLNERPVRTFTAGFPGAAVHDERRHAREVALAVGADPVDVEFTEADFWRMLPEVAAAMDDPAADYAILPTYKLAQAARAEGLKVVLCGEGGDELFAGYGRYRTADRTWPFNREMRRTGMLDGLGVLREEGRRRPWRAGIAAAECAAAGAGWTKLQTVQAVDCADWLPHDLLTKLDRCLMANGVEGRVPFLDPAVARFAFLLPDALKIRRGHGKWLLRRWLETGLPASRPFTRKRGFTVPVGEWMRRRGRALGRLVATQDGVVEACRMEAVEALFQSDKPRHGKRPGPCCFSPCGTAGTSWGGRPPVTFWKPWLAPERSEEAMSEHTTPRSGHRPTAEDIVRARAGLGEGEAVLLPCVGAITGREEAIILLAEAAAEELAGALGYFGGPLAVAIFAAVTLTELAAPDIALATGADGEAVREEIARLESGGFLYHQQVDGTPYFAAGNPPLKRYFAKRFAPKHRFHP